MTLRSILVATDFSPFARRAALRAGLLARELGVRRAMLLHALPRQGLLQGDERRARRARSRQLREFAAELKRATGAHFTPRLVQGDVVEVLARAARGAGLVVMGAQGAHPLRDFAIGTTTERLLRKIGRPVLVVKSRPAAAYRNVLVPVDFSPDARVALSRAARFAPGAQINVLHAFDAPFEGKLRFAGVAEENVLRYRLQARERARSEMDAMLARLDLPAERVTRLLRFGYPSRVIARAEAEIRADLVAIGKHGRSALEDLLLGSTTLRTLATAACDVLVVPAREKD